MGRGAESVCQFCRRENLKLFLKGERCNGDKCAFTRRSYPPGQHGHRRTKVSDYGLQLREKQKVKRIYGVWERQFAGHFENAERSKQNTGTELLQRLERRLDNVVYRLGFADSRKEARQLVTHGHFLLNGKAVNVPNAVLSLGDVVSVRLRSQKAVPILRGLENGKKREVPGWLELNSSEWKGTVRALPDRNQITLPIEENLVVELYSR